MLMHTVTGCLFVCSRQRYTTFADQFEHGTLKVAQEGLVVAPFDVDWVLGSWMPSVSQTIIEVRETISLSVSVL